MGFWDALKSVQDTFPIDCSVWLRSLGFGLAWRATLACPWRAPGTLSLRCPGTRSRTHAHRASEPGCSARRRVRLSHAARRRVELRTRSHCAPTVAAARSPLPLTLRGCTRVGLPPALAITSARDASPRYCLLEPASVSTARCAKPPSSCELWRCGRTSWCRTRTRTWCHQRRAVVLSQLENAPRQASCPIALNRAGRVAPRQNPQSLALPS